MNKKSLLLAFVGVVVLGSLIYTFTGTTDPKLYLENIAAERERQFKFLKYNIDSPLEEDQKRNLTPWISIR